MIVSGVRARQAPPREQAMRYFFDETFGK